MATAPFPVTPELAAIAIRYRNSRMIADAVLPRVPVAKQEFKYWTFALSEGFTVPDTRVGRRSRPGQVEFSGTETPSKTDDFALDDVIPQEDIDNAPANYDPLGRAAEGVADLIALDREVRAASLVFALGTYPSAQRTTLSGSSQWSDFTNSDPISAITGGLDTMVMRANVMVIGQLAWTKLSQHPKVVKAVYGYASDAGIATRAQVAALFELDEVLVGQAFLNSAKKGQAVSMGRVWGKHAALIHRDGLADNRADVKGAIVLDEQTDVAVVQRVLPHGYAPNLTDVDLEKIGRAPFLIAAALRAPDRIVVTREVSKPSKQGANRKIPDVCQTFGVPCINDFALWRKLNFSIS